MDEFTLTIDFDDLTLGDIDEIEDRVGKSFSEVTQAFTNGATDVRMGKVLRAFALIQMRRTNPNVTWEDTASVKMPKVEVEDFDPPAPPSVPSV